MFVLIYIVVVVEKLKFFLIKLIVRVLKLIEIKSLVFIFFIKFFDKERCIINMLLFESVWGLEKWNKILFNVNSL